MKVKFGALIVEGRGKLAGWVLSRNRGGAYARQKVTPLNPASAYSTTIRARLASLSTGWRSLSASVRIAWNSAVSAYQKSDIFGDLKTPSGKNLYTSLNMNRLTLGEALLTVPPAPVGVSALTSASAVADVSDDKLTLTYAPAIPATEKILIDATPPLSAGISFVKSEFRAVQIIATADASPHELGPAYRTRFGSIGLAGQKIFIRMRNINLASGIVGQQTIISTIVVT